VRNVRDRYAEIFSLAPFSYPALEWRYRFTDAASDHDEQASVQGPRNQISGGVEKHPCSDASGRSSYSTPRLAQSQLRVGILEHAGVARPRLGSWPQSCWTVVRLLTSGCYLRNTPEAPVRAFLMVIARNPEAVIAALHPAQIQANKHARQAARPKSKHCSWTS
jgi:hypothetical protein